MKRSEGWGGARDSSDSNPAAENGLEEQRGVWEQDICIGSNLGCKQAGSRRRTASDDMKSNETLQI